MENPQSAGVLQQEEDIVAEPSMKTIVVKPHRATDGTQLDLLVNDIVYVLEQDETGWWGGHKEGEDVTGWFPGSCVRILPDQPSLEQQPLEQEPLAADSTSAPAATHHPADEAGAGAEPQATQDDADKSRQCMSPPQRCSLGGRPVASPQRMSTLDTGATPGGIMIPGTPAAGMDESTLGPEAAAGLMGNSSKVAGAAAAANTSCGRYSIADVEVLAVENAKLLQANQELSDCLKRIQRQSDATHNNLEKMEVAAQMERERREALERKLQAEAMEKTTISSEAAALRDALERHRRDSQAQIEANEQMQRLYESKLQEKMEEVRSIEDSSRKVVLSEKQRVRQLEEQIVLCQRELDTVRRNSVIQAVAPTAAATSSSLQDEGTRRRLFSSTAEMDNVGGGFTPVAQRHSPIEEQPCQAWGSAPAPSPTSASRMAASPEGCTSRGRAEAGRTPPTGPRSGPGVPPAPPASYATGGSRGASLPRAGAPRPCASPTSGASSTAPARHRSSSIVRTVEEEPPRGIVADKVAVFNQQIAKTRESTAEGMRNERSSSRCGTRSRQSSMDGRARAAAKPYGGEYGFGGYTAVGSAPLATVVPQPKVTVAAVPAVESWRAASPRAPGGLALPTEAIQEPENVDEEQIFLGMSPMRKNRSEAPEAAAEQEQVSSEGVSVFARIRKLEIR